MAKKVEETHSSINSESSPHPTTPPMASLLRRVRVFFNRISGFAINSSETNQSPRSSSSSSSSRRTFHRDVEQEEFLYASSHCLSSYYSVFVVRLAIMESIQANGSLFLKALSKLIPQQLARKQISKLYILHWEASEWNELTQILQEHFKAKSNAQCSPRECSKAESLNKQEVKDSVFIIVVDIGLLDLNTDIWKEQLNFLDKYCGKAKFAWILNHDTSNTIKMELRSKGHLLMVNRPLYKAKMIQILEAAIKESNLELQKKTNAFKSMTAEGDLHECLELDPIQYDAASSDDSDKSEMGSSNSTRESHTKEKQIEYSTTPCPSQRVTVNNCFVELSQVYSQEGDFCTNDPNQFRSTSRDNSKCQELHLTSSCSKEQGSLCSRKVVNEQKALEGICILLAEDTPVLQRVATIMLEKLGATVVAVGDGMQAVDALKIKLSADECRRGSTLEDGNARTQTKIEECLPYDLILMDCQMPKMDGYEATKAIRKSELGTSSHIPIVALTAHAMSSDEAKCLEVGMDAYLTKPIDRKLMVSTILSLTKRMA